MSMVNPVGLQFSDMNSQRYAVKLGVLADVMV
jgi:hypothetical protein